MRFVAVILPLVSFLCSCKKDRINVETFFDCNNSQNLDSSATANKLIGQWKWVKQSCDTKIKTADKNLIVAFNSNQTFAVSENSAIITSGIWNVHKVEFNLYGLVLSQLNEYLSGRILFCGNQLLFNDSYKDGCDNLFTKN